MINTAEVEAALMGSILADPAGQIPLAMADGVAADWFCDDPWAVTWLAIRAIWERGAAGDTDAVAILAEARRIAQDPETKLPANRLATFDAYQRAIDLGAGTISAHVDTLKRAVLERRIRAMLGKEASKFQTEHAAVVGVAMREGLDRILGDDVSSKKSRRA